MKKFGLFLILWMPWIALAQTDETVRIEDARGDDFGAGSVQYPMDKLFQKGNLDITEFRALPFSGGVQFEIDFALRIPRPPEDQKISQRTYLRELQNNGLFLMNVDIYIDQDGTPGSGEVQTIPGRNADIHPDSGWEKAVILTPQAAAAESILKMADSKMASNVVFPLNPQLKGKTLTIRVSDDELGGAFDPQWGYVVAVTGAAFEESFRLLDPNIRGFGKSIFARIVRPSRDDEYFGGGDHDGWNSNIIDLALPPLMDQKKMLTPDSVAGKWPVLEAVFPNGRPPLRTSSGQNAPPTATEVPAVQQPAAISSPEAVPTAPEVVSTQPEAVPTVPETVSTGSDAVPTAPKTLSTPPPVGNPEEAAPVVTEATQPTLTGTVIDFDSTVVVVDVGKNQKNRLGRLGRVVDDQGKTLVRFVVSELLPDFAVGKITEGEAETLIRGMKVELKSGGEP